MDMSSGEITALVFRRVIQEGQKEFPVDSQMLKVLMELDGKTPLAVVARRTGLDMGSMRKSLSRLLKLKLIEPVESAVPVLDKDFMDHLTAQLSLAVGPIAQVLIEDGAVDLGHEPNRFPSHRAAELVDLLARQVQREDRKAEFKEEMLRKIREKGY